MPFGTSELERDAVLAKLFLGRGSLSAPIKEALSKLVLCLPLIELYKGETATKVEAMVRMFAELNVMRTFSLCKTLELWKA